MKAKFIAIIIGVVLLTTGCGSAWKKWTGATKELRKIPLEVAKEYTKDVKANVKLAKELLKTWEVTSVVILALMEDRLPIGIQNRMVQLDVIAATEKDKKAMPDSMYAYSLILMVQVARGLVDEAIPQLVRYLSVILPGL
ncbi:MAG TPA: hypothetical protein ENI27_02305 [bacterium]|nr:hypothetical protein [bacterium]